MYYKTVIRKLREQYGYTQEYVGKVLKKSQQGYNHIETGNAEIKAEELIALCNLYNVSADFILGLTDDLNPTVCSIDEKAILLKLKKLSHEDKIRIEERIDMLLER